MPLHLAPNIPVLPVITTLDINAERVLKGAQEALLTHCVVIGRAPDGALYFASSVADGGTVLWDIEEAKLQLFGVFK